jgi:uncharacterized protein (TIRG00374 family)
LKQFRFLVYSIILAIAGYGVWAGMNDGVKILQAIDQIGTSGLLFLCGLSLINYLLRYGRWLWLLQRLGDRFAFVDGMLCYCAGFALTTTPGKAGEAIRCLYFKNRHGVDTAHSFAALLADRLADLLSAMVLASIALFYFDHFRWVAWAMLVVAATVLLMVFRPALLLLICRTLEPRLPASFQPFLAAVPRFIERSTVLLSPSVLLISTIVGVVSWGAEAYGFAWLAHQLGSNTEVFVLIGIFCLAMLAGCFMPGGLGGTEAAMAVLLAAIGVGPAEAFVIALICRLATLWLAVAIGLLSMLWLEYHPLIYQPGEHPSHTGTSVLKEHVLKEKVLKENWHDR